MSAELTERQSENPVAKRIEAWKVVRSKWLLDEYHLQFEASERPEFQGQFKNVKIFHITPSAGANDLVVTIGKGPLGLEGLVGVYFTPHLAKLTKDQRVLVYGSIASCLDPQRFPLDPPVDGLSWDFTQEFRTFVSDLYKRKSDIYERACFLRNAFIGADRRINLASLD